MSDLSDLYQELILDHQKNPRNFGQLEHPKHPAEWFNALCGDKISLDLLNDESGVIQDLRLNGSGCAISKASASMMTAALKGKKVDEAETIFTQFHEMVTGKSAPESGEALGKLKVFAGVRDYPARVKCASLAWHTLEAALHDDQKIVSSDEEEA